MPVNRARGAASEAVRFLRTEQVGGLILLAATAAALILSNSPFSGAYHRLSDATIGPAALHLDLTVRQWATDGLLTVFFVVVGVELKREILLGELRDPRRAALPIAAALGGMVVPAAIALLVAAGAPGAADAWAVPVATDIAFALAVLALAARSLPAGLRVFLLTLAIVDDIGAIVLIAVVFSGHIAVLPLLGSLGAIAGYALLQRLRVPGPWPYLALGVLAWALLHASGVHATLAGVAVGLATRVRPDPGERHTPAQRLEHAAQPVSAGFCVPAFAFFAAGVPLSAAALRAFATDRVALAVVAGLVVGKTLGVFGAATLAAATGLGRLPDGLAWRDLLAVSVLTGCGFTVSLLITDLAFEGSAQADRVTIAVLVGSLIASLLSAMLLRRQVRSRLSDPETSPSSP
ncbi:MAG TPA: Na+/H+ antiporter NhaA [Micromonosporaceae bacterium]